MMARMDVKDHKSIKIEKYAEESIELDLEEVIDDEEEEEDCEELQLPRPASWIDPETGNVVQGLEVFSLKYESHVGQNNNHTRRGDEFDVCPICYHLWTTNGTHRLCCLPCGHMYGLSCIETWLQTSRSAKCPQCKTLCTLKDVRLLYATRLCIPNATSAADHIVADQMASNRCFPYSAAGVNAYRDYELGRILYASHKRFDVLKRREGDEFDVCPICYHLWTTNGTHQLCCLPCGHMYGLSCIETWLQTGGSRTRKCPQCKTSCTMKDVRLLFATRLCIPDADATAHLIVLDQKASNRCFPYSAAGVNAYRDYELGRFLYASHKRFDVLKRRDDVLGQQNVAMKRQTTFLNLKAHAEKQAKSLEQRAGAMGRANSLRRGADVFGLLADKYLQKADAFGRRADAYGRRADAYGRRAQALVQRRKKFDESILFFRERFKEHCMTGRN